MFVTSPSPENLNTLFEFVFKGFDALEFQVCNPAKMACCYYVLFNCGGKILSSAKGDWHRPA